MLCGPSHGVLPSPFSGALVVLVQVCLVQPASSGNEQIRRKFRGNTQVVAMNKCGESLGFIPGNLRDQGIVGVGVAEQ